MSRYLARTICSFRAPKFTARCLPRHVSTTPNQASSSLGHQRRELEYPMEKGLGNFLTPEGLNTIAVEWQQGLLDRLNEEIKDTELWNQSVMQVVISTASQKSASLAFMYASQALNNSFFLDNLKPLVEIETSHESEISAALMQKITGDFGMLTHLKSTMSAAALGMSSSGWVWLVQDANGRLGIVPTFGPGTVLVRNRMQRSMFFTPVVGEVDDPRFTPDANVPPPTTASPLSGSSMRRKLPTPTPTNKTRAPPSRQFFQAPTYNPGDIDAIFTQTVSNFNKVGDDLCPLFCISIHEHAWMSSGYGVWGKEEYLKRFWTVLDWGKVSRTSELWLGSTVQR